jgi:glycosyltransferase involved in cell wall biosynthesis
MHVSLITSLYRTEMHLSTYIQYAREIAAQAAAQGINIEYVVVANDATAYEREFLKGFDAKVIHVSRESLYASWNRGVKAASGEAIGFWNVDDIRTVDGIVEGYRKITQGCKLVYFAHTVIRTQNGREERRTYPAVPFDVELHRRVMKCGPFFMFSPSLYREVGGFDERFRIVGDWEWCVRATDRAEFCPLDLIGGYFLLHGANLSDTGNPLQVAEENIVYLLQGAYNRLVPVEPDVMRKTWEKWGFDLPPEIQDRMWGEGAAEGLARWKKEVQHKRRITRLDLAIRYLPKQMIDRTGLRPYLAKLGIVKNRK